MKLITDNDLLLAGLGIYWGEGAKSDIRVCFCNSDPLLIKFMLRWLYVCFAVSVDQLQLRVEINEIYQSDIETINQFWYKVTDAKPEQFTKPQIRRIMNSKVYPERGLYNGTLRVTVSKSSTLQRQILGLLEGLKQSQLAA